MDKLKNYRGNKNILGLYQFIINRIPECENFTEVFGGSGAITKKLLSILEPGKVIHTAINDCDRSVTHQLKKNFKRSATVITNYTAAQVFSSVMHSGKETVLYCDPPYKFSTRGSSQRIYKHEMTDSDHEQFLTMATTAKVNCMISHYQCQLYDEMLKGWNRESFQVCYHGQVKSESLYYNFEKPVRLLTYKYVGTDCWDRQRVTRKIDRLSKKLLALPALERNAIISRVNNSLNQNQK